MQAESGRRLKFVVLATVVQHVQICYLVPLPILPLPLIFPSIFPPLLSSPPLSFPPLSSLRQWCSWVCMPLCSCRQTMSFFISFSFFSPSLIFDCFPGLLPSWCSHCKAWPQHGHHITTFMTLMCLPCPAPPLHHGAPTQLPHHMSLATQQCDAPQVLPHKLHWHVLAAPHTSLCASCSACSSPAHLNLMYPSPALTSSLQLALAPAPNTMPCQAAHQ